MASCEGIIRTARRPAGWVPPGPAPAGPGDRSDLWPAAGEDLCYLSGDWRIFQRVTGHRWSLDDLVAAHLAARSMPSPPERFLDLGCGIGSVLMMIAWRFPEARGVGIEAQALSAGLARRSLAYNGAAERVEVRSGDLREEARDGRIYPLVTGTPPYFPPGTSTESEVDQRLHCRVEMRGGVEAYVEAAARSLAPGGRFVLCAQHPQAARVVEALDAAKLSVHERVNVVPREGKAPLLVLYVTAWEPGPGREWTFAVRDAAGAWTPEFVEVRTAMGLPPSPP